MLTYKAFIDAECDDAEVQELLDLNRKWYDLATRPEARESLMRRIRVLEEIMGEREEA